METIISHLQNSLSYAVPMIVLLGLLIFVHELGHFLVAKYFKVRVEVFSLGFGPKIFRFKRGDTTYAVSAIPLGGYVKMFGDDPSAQIQEDQKSFSFTHKPVGQRISIVLAGPLMNFFFAVLLFMLVAFSGEQMFSPRVGDVEAGSAAAKAGFHPGDRIVSVNAQPVMSWDDVQKAVEGNGEKPVAVTLQHEGSTQDEQINVTPKTVKNKNVLSWDSYVGEIQGLSLNSRASAIGVISPETPAALAGLKTGDQIAEINGQKIDKWRELVPEFDKALTGDKIKLSVIRGILEGKENPPISLELPVPATAKALHGEEAMKAVGIEVPELYIARLEKNSPAMKAGLQVGDKITGVDGKPVQMFEEVAKVIRSHPSEDKTLSVSLVRDGKPLEIGVLPNLNTRMTSQGKEEKRFEIGISPLVYDSLPQTFEWRTSNPVDAVAKGFSQTFRWTSITVLSFVRLFQNEVSAKNIGGFLSIGQMAKRSWANGLSAFLVMMAIISINLFILNLLPVPVLDGGHLLFFSIEALRGAPLSMRKLEIAQQVGLILLLGLMVFALFNDVTRIFNLG